MLKSTVLYSLVEKLSSSILFLHSNAGLQMSMRKCKTSFSILYVQ